MDTGELFMFVQQQWRCTGLFCLGLPFAITQLMEKVERMRQIMQAELEVEQQTPVMSIGRTPGQFEVPPPLPMMDEPEQQPFSIPILLSQIGVPKVVPSMRSISNHRSHPVY